MNIFLGNSISEGINLGKAFVIPDQQQRVIPHEQVREEDISEQWSRFKNATEAVKNKINSQLTSLNPDSKSDKIQKELLETYALMLEDPVFISELKTDLETKRMSIEFLLQDKTESYADRLRNSGNDYLAERAQDIEDIFGSVLDDLLDIHVFSIDEIPDDSVIIATNLTPSQTIVLSKKRIAGLALIEGGISSHVAILARNYDIPAVFGAEEVTKQIKTGQQVIVDGTAGEVIVSPDEITLADYIKKIKLENEHKARLLKFRNLPGQTKDGTRFTMMANIGTPKEARMALEEGADGIGLFRTEFLFMADTTTKHKLANRALSEEEQFKAYKEVLEIMGDKPVTIRTLDSGGDKNISVNDIPKIEETNPLMGLRAIRLTLNYPALFKTQLRALYRASVYGNLKIMLPLITNVDQVRKAKALAKEVMEELEAEDIPFNKNVPMGIMVETAAAAIVADCMAKECDFFSIGTNDLTQYTLGVDRENKNVAHLFNEFHLAVLRLIQNTIEAAVSSKIDVSVCGEMAGKVNSAMVLAGMGVRTLSMSPKQISSVKEMLSKITVQELQAVSEKSLNRL